jgi:hypothetical protein
VHDQRRADRLVIALGEVQAGQVESPPADGDEGIAQAVGLFRERKAREKDAERSDLLIRQRWNKSQFATGHEAIRRKRRKNVRAGR